MRRFLAVTLLAALFSLVGYSQDYPKEWDEFLTAEYYHALKFEVNKTNGSGAW